MNYIEKIELVLFSHQVKDKFVVEKHFLDHFCANVIHFGMDTSLSDKEGNSPPMILFTFKHSKDRRKNLGFLNASSPEAKMIRLTEALRKLYPGCKIQAVYTLVRTWESHQVVSE